MTSFYHQFDFFMMSFITYGIVTLTIDDVTSFLQLSDIQNVRKNTCFSLIKRSGNSLSRFKMAEWL